MALLGATLWLLGVLGTSRAPWPPWRASVLHGDAGRHCLPCLQPDAPVPACRLGPDCLLLGVWPRDQVKLWKHCVYVMESEDLVRPVSAKKQIRLLLAAEGVPHGSLGRGRHRRGHLSYCLRDLCWGAFVISTGHTCSHLFYHHPLRTIASSTYALGVTRPPVSSDKCSTEHWPHGLQLRP